jgi:hypothetical protein
VRREDRGLVEAPTFGATAPPLTREAAGQSAHRVFGPNRIYFDLPATEIVKETRLAFSEHLTGAFAWGYGHYFVFASAAATGAGLGLTIDQVTHRSDLSNLTTGFALTIPVSVYLLVVWILHLRYKASSLVRNYAVPIGIVLIVTSSATPEPVLSTGMIMLVLVGVSISVGSDEDPERTG